jgi:hypothetical protein
MPPARQSSGKMRAHHNILIDLAPDLGSARDPGFLDGCQTGAKWFRERSKLRGDGLIRLRRLAIRSPPMLQFTQRLPGFDRSDLGSASSIRQDANRTTSKRDSADHL